jgi:hypothetical protein
VRSAPPKATEEGRRELHGCKGNKRASAGWSTRNGGSQSAATAENRKRASLTDERERVYLRRNLIPKQRLVHERHDGGQVS